MIINLISISSFQGKAPALWKKIFFGLLLIALPLKAESASFGLTSSHLRHFRKAEKKYRLPPKLLEAIAFVESRHTPWAVYGHRRSRFFSSKEEAVAHIKALKRRGVSNINVGLMQINLAVHKFRDLEKVLDPGVNIDYGAHLLKRLYARYRSWEKAIKYYHSPFPGHQEDYKRKIYKTMARMTESTPEAVAQKLTLVVLKK